MKINDRKNRLFVYFCFTDKALVLSGFRGLAGGVDRMSNLSKLESDGDLSRKLAEAIIRNLFLNN